MEHRGGRGRKGGRYLRIPAWAAVRYARCADSSLKRCSVDFKTHKPIPYEDLLGAKEIREDTAEGLLFDAAEEVVPGTVLELVISMLPEKEAVTVRGRVIEVRKCAPGDDRYQVTLDFMAGSDAEKENITGFLKNYYT